MPFFVCDFILQIIQLILGGFKHFDFQWIANQRAIYTSKAVARGHDFKNQPFWLQISMSVDGTLVIKRELAIWSQFKVPHVNY